MLMKMRNTKGFTLVELMIVVAIIGILAAIAIPAFLRSVKKSKTSEAEGTMRKMADGAKNYFASEQRYSNSMTGDQPWHAGNSSAGVASSFGMPVPWGAYVFPGGAFSFNTTDAGAATTTCTGGPTGGSKQLPPAAFAGTNTVLSSTLNKLGVSFADPIYFQYNYTSAGVAQAATATIMACAEFKVMAPAHTINQVVSVNAATQEVQVGPASTTNEFE